MPHINPAVGRVILKCLEPDPANRPRSVIEVLREVPGGRLEEALFRGRTPSPRDVSEAGPEGSLTPRVGMALFGLALTGIVLAAWLNDSAALFRQTSQELSPRELSVRTRAHLKELGCSGFMPENPREHWQERKNMLLGLIALPIGGWFARRNWKLRRANPFGASVVGVSFVALGLGGWLLAAKHVSAAADELSMFTGMAGRVLFDGLLLWLAYLALEPWVRRTSPRHVVSWNRLLGGRWSDPLVGRDVLTGVAAASGFVSLLLFLRALPGWLGHTPDPKIVWDPTFTEGAGSLLLTVQIGVMVALRSFFLYFLVLLVCRGRVRLAACLNVAIWWGLYAHGGDYPVVIGLVGLAFAAASLFVLLRAGLLGFVAFNLVEQVLIYMPVTTDLSAWYAGVSALSLALLVGFAAYGSWAAVDPFYG